MPEHLRGTSGAEFQREERTDQEMTDVCVCEMVRSSKVRVCVCMGLCRVSGSSGCFFFPGLGKAAKLSVCGRGKPRAWPAGLTY